MCNVYWKPPNVRFSARRSRLSQCRRAELRGAAFEPRGVPADAAAGRAAAAAGAAASKGWGGGAGVALKKHGGSSKPGGLLPGRLGCLAGGSTWFHMGYRKGYILSAPRKRPIGPFRRYNHGYKETKPSSSSYNHGLGGRWKDPSGERWSARRKKPIGPARWWFYLVSQGP